MTKRIVAAIAFFGAFGIGQAAEPIRAELLFGACKYGAEGNGIWYVQQYPHTLEMDTNCGFLGFSRIERRVEHVGIGWRIGYVDLGKAKFDSIFPMRDDEHYLPVMSGHKCNESDFTGCLGRGVGYQTARGLSFGAIAELRMDSLTFGVDAGVFVYEGKFAVDVVKYPSGSYPDAAWLHPRWGGWRGTPYLGLTAQWGWLHLSTRAYHSIHARESGCAYCTGIASREAYQATAGLSIPF